MGFAHSHLSKIDGLSFYKLFGTGSGHGFTNNLNPLSNSGVYAILAVWNDEEVATNTLKSASIFKRYRKYSIENWNLFLNPTSVKGVWSGIKPFKSGQVKSKGQVVALTRATIKPHLIFKFWRKVPDIQKVIGSDNNVLFKIGLGEVPFLHQVTFSIWPNENDMNTFARKGGPHASAIEAVRAEEWFSEELYARFQIIKQIGSWNGQSKILDYNLK